MAFEATAKEEGVRAEIYTFRPCSSRTFAGTPYSTGRLYDRNNLIGNIKIMGYPFT